MWSCRAETNDFFACSRTAMSHLSDSSVQPRSLASAHLIGCLFKHSMSTTRTANDHTHYGWRTTRSAEDTRARQLPKVSLRSRCRLPTSFLGTRPLAGPGGASCPSSASAEPTGPRAGAARAACASRAITAAAVGRPRRAAAHETPAASFCGSRAPLGPSGAPCPSSATAEPTGPRAEAARAARAGRAIDPAAGAAAPFSRRRRPAQLPSHCQLLRSTPAAASLPNRSS